MSTSVNSFDWALIVEFFKYPTTFSKYLSFWKSSYENIIKESLLYLYLILTFKEAIDAEINDENQMKQFVLRLSKAVF